MHRPQELHVQCCHLVNMIEERCHHYFGPFVCVFVYAEHRHQFWWFGHSYSHTKPHLFSSLSGLVDDMQHNYAFAQVLFASLSVHATFSMLRLRSPPSLEL